MTNDNDKDVGDNNNKNTIPNKNNNNNNNSNDKNKNKNKNNNNKGKKIPAVNLERAIQPHLPLLLRLLSSEKNHILQIIIIIHIIIMYNQ